MSRIREFKCNSGSDSSGYSNSNSSSFQSVAVVEGESFLYCLDSVLVNLVCTPYRLRNPEKCSCNVRVNVSLCVPLSL